MSLLSTTPSSSTTMTMRAASAPRRARGVAGSNGEEGRRRRSSHVVAASRKRRQGKNTNKKGGGSGDGGEDFPAGDGEAMNGGSGAPAAALADVGQANAATGVYPRGVKEKEEEMKRPGVAAAAAAAGGVRASQGGDDGGSPATAAVADPLPAVSRDDVLDSCVGTTVWMLGIGLVLREGTHFGQGTLPAAVPDWTASLPLVAALHPPFPPSDLAVHAAVAVGAAAAVTGARAALLKTWPDFAEATNRSNAQVLTPLYKGDVVTVSVLPAVAEEALFRGKPLLFLFFFN